MPYLQLRDSRYPLARGAATVGRGESADIRLPFESGAPARSAVAIIDVSEDGSATLRSQVEGAALTVNGVPVGVQAAPMLHGDRVVIDGCELRFADESHLGETIDFPIGAIDSVIAAPSPLAAESRSGGRLLSLVDGREYAVSPAGLTIGRDAACDIVISSPEVSRRHSEIRETPLGYTLLDRSTNGVLVNGKRVWAEFALARGDMIRIGREEFRFYAEIHSGAVISDLESVPSLNVTAARPVMKRPPPAAEIVRDFTEAAEPAKQRKVLATLEIINEGPSKGKQFELTTPLANVGRGDHNDVMVRDESVSESHAKLQRREDGWFLADMGSTNGTYLNGVRINGEARLGTGADVRFGGVKMIFRPAGGAMRASGGTRVIVGFKGPDPKRADQRPREEAARPEVPDDQASRTGTAPWLLVLLLIALIGYTIFLVTGGGVN